MTDPRETRYFEELDKTEEINSTIEQLFEDNIDDFIERIKEFIPQLTEDVITPQGFSEDVNSYILREVAKKFEEEIKITY
jgi:argonaute-like protein implicated in RNA metabolism and viral defense